jgi:hypothetical protein
MIVGAARLPRLAPLPRHPTVPDVDLVRLALGYGTL